MTSKVIFYAQKNIADYEKTEFFVIHRKGVTLKGYYVVDNNKKNQMKCSAYVSH